MDMKEIANLLIAEEDEKLQKEIEEARLMPISVKEKRNANALFREEIGIDKLPHPEADNSFERFRSAFYLRYPRYPWMSRLHKSRKLRDILK